MGKQNPRGKSEQAQKMDKYLQTPHPEPDRVEEQEQGPTIHDPPRASQVVAVLEPSNAEILAAITSSHTSTTAQLESIKVDTSLLRQDLQALRERTTEAEGRISTIEDTIAPYSDIISTLQQKVATLTARAEDSENRNRRNNLRIVGLPEGSEGRAPEAFVEAWLKQTLGEEVFSAIFIIERAHRVPTRPLPPGAPPRPLIMRFLNYRDRDAVMTAARKKGQLTHNGANISIYPDYSQVVQKQRASYQGVKRRLRNAGILYSMLYPAKLRVVQGDRTHFFVTALDADKWLDTLPPSRQNSPRRNGGEGNGGNPA
ncbi:NIMA-related kinase 6 S homeolog isoform X1 [Xenopus laevis]|uniref:NIMA-related kinase 6 S homeolog isoform X1 n=1 Tax=Xenopus laevis TaxID=8355 RepID=A0A8J1LMU7_XENLA|nr:NIMA-related kinase 6 S homeolog isoform X1 [Xenopus laevis]